jgi:hypothetical protein
MMGYHQLRGDFLPSSFDGWGFHWLLYYWKEKLWIWEIGWRSSPIWRIQPFQQVEFRIGWQLLIGILEVMWVIIWLLPSFFRWKSLPSAHKRGLHTKSSERYYYMGGHRWSTIHACKLDRTCACIHQLFLPLSYTLDSNRFNPSRRTRPSPHSRSLCNSSVCVPFSSIPRKFSHRISSTMPPPFFVLVPLRSIGHHNRGRGRIWVSYQARPPLSVLTIRTLRFNPV